ncbi:MAG: BON domain-containing protein [Vicinamibacteria bacterium]
MKNKVIQAAAVSALALFVSAAPAMASDTWITTKAKIALLTADDVSATAVKVDTQNGNVVIHGKVKTEAEKAKAEQVVKSIEGVQTVKNLLQVVAPSQKDMVDANDDQIKDKVNASLKADGLNDVKIESVNKGVVLLAGKTDSLGRKLAAIESAYKVAGVKRVSSTIETNEK